MSTRSNISPPRPSSSPSHLLFSPKAEAELIVPAHGTTSHDATQFAKEMVVGDCARDVRWPKDRFPVGITASQLERLPSLFLPITSGGQSYPHSSPLSSNELLNAVLEPTFAPNDPLLAANPEALERYRSLRRVVYGGGVVTEQKHIDEMEKALERRRSGLPQEYRTSAGHPKVDYCFGSLNAEATHSLAIGLRQLVLLALTFPVTTGDHMYGRRHHLKAARERLAQRTEKGNGSSEPVGGREGDSRKKGEVEVVGGSVAMDLGKEGVSAPGLEGKFAGRSSRLLTAAHRHRLTFLLDLLPLPYLFHHRPSQQQMALQRLRPHQRSARPRFPSPLLSATPHSSSSDASHHFLLRSKMPSST